MGDPFSVAASTASFVSLGIQVCDGLISYCRAWRSHDKEIEEALERLTDLELILKNLSGILSIVESLDDSTAETLHGARHQIRSCTAVLNKLYGILIESESIGKPAGILDKLHNVRLRSTSLFNREKFTNLWSSVKETRGNLSSAIQILNLHLVVKQNTALQILATDSKKQASEMPNAIENALVKQLELHGHHFNTLKQDVQNVSSQHAQALQQVTQSITALQLGMIQKPSLIQAAYEEERRLQSLSSNSTSWPFQHCTCRALTRYKSLTGSQSYRHREDSTPRRWNAAIIASTLVHRRDCALYGKKAEEANQFGLRLSYSGALLAGTIQASMSIIRGSGGFSISPTLSFNPIVSSDAPAFKILDIRFSARTSASDMHATFAFRKQELSQVYLQGKASPRDVDQEGNTVLHIACRIFDGRFNTKMDSNTFSLYFQFLQGLYELGVPLNGTNAQGLTPLGVLVQMYERFGGVYKRLITLLSLKMLGIGAELPLFTQETIRASSEDTCVLGQEFTKFPEFAEAVGCNELSQAIFAKSRSWLVSAIRRDPTSINRPNAIGQTPLHFSVEWPESMHLLLDAGAAVDAADNFGFSAVTYAVKRVLLEPLKILAEADCVLHLFPDRYGGGALGAGGQSLLELIMEIESWSAYYWYSDIASRDDAEAMFDIIVSYVAKRRRMLEVLIRTSLDSQSIGQLRLSPEKILDHQTSTAIRMLQRTVEIPKRLKGLSPLRSTVYHIHYLNLRQARVLWNAGFRDMNELDSFGQSALMKRHVEGHDLLEGGLELVGWLVSKGADLHCVQSHAFQWHQESLWGICRTDKASSTTALHYLAVRWANYFYYEVRTSKENERLLSRISALTEEARQIVRTVLTDPLCDSCNCACSEAGCRAYTVLVKHRIMEALKFSNFSTRYARKIVLRITQVLAQSLDVNASNLAWLRCDMLRFNTFEKLRLRHTCCSMEYFRFGQDVIVELGDEDDRHEIREEQAEQIETLERLLIDFKKKLDESAVPLSEFLDGYWKDRMMDVMSNQAPINQKKLASMGVSLCETSSTSSQSSEDEERIEEPDLITQISKYLNRIEHLVHSPRRSIQHHETS